MAGETRNGAAESAETAPVRPGTITIGLSLPLILLTLLVGAVVTLAAGGTQLLRPAAALDATWTLGLRIAGMALVAAGIAGLLVQRERLRGGRRGGADPAFVALRTAGTIMAVLFALALLNPPDGTSSGGARSPLSFGPPAPFGSDAGADEREARTRGGDPVITAEDEVQPWNPITLEYIASEDATLLERLLGLAPRILLFLLILLGIAYLARRLRPEIEERTFELPLEPAQAEAGLVASLADVAHYGADPRGQITAAYHRLLAALAAAGASREPHEAPHEHLHRVLGALGVRPEPLHRLTGLYVLAQFGGRPVTEEHRAAAAAALEESLADVRASAAVSGAGAGVGGGAGGSGGPGAGAGGADGGGFGTGQARGGGANPGEAFA